MIIDNLPNEDKGNIMRTIADVYREEGFEKGISQGISIGEQKGISIGVEKTAVNLLIFIIMDRINYLEKYRIS